MDFFYPAIRQLILDYLSCDEQLYVTEQWSDIKRIDVLSEAIVVDLVLWRVKENLPLFDKVCEVASRNGYLQLLKLARSQDYHLERNNLQLCSCKWSSRSVAMASLTRMSV